MHSKRSQKKRQQNAHHLVAARRFVMLVKDGLRIGICVRAHFRISPCLDGSEYASRRGMVPGNLNHSLYPPRHCPTSRRAANIESASKIESMMNPQGQSASASGTFFIGGDLPVHRLGYGTMRLVGDGAWGEPADPDEARRVLRRAVELGITLIDTADAYGPEIAERLIGEALAPYPPGLVIATKGGITRQGPAQTEYVGRAGYLIQCVEMSLRRLKLERIDLYQLHRIDPRTPLEESLGALKKMQEQGKIRHIGLSEVTPEQITEAQKIVAIVSVQNRYSLADRRHEETLA